ncbi:MAG: serine/threonine-protein kinase [Planctomycetota bacterium]
MPTRRSLGSYLLLEPLGEGATSWVFRAEHRRTGDAVAAKIFKPAPDGQPERLARFHREAELGASIRSPHVIAIHATGSVDGLPYMICDLLRGYPLSEILAVKGRLGWPQAAALARRAAHGLHDLHVQRVIHRDIKPANIFATRDGAVTVMDLGLAKRIDGEPITGMHAGGAAALGTPAYMAPEQIAAPESVDERTDLYALGVTLYHLIAGQPPFCATDPYAVMEAVLAQRPAFPNATFDGCPGPLLELLDALLAKSPDSRPPDATRVRHVLGRILDEHRAPEHSYAFRRRTESVLSSTARR